MMVNEDEGMKKIHYLLRLVHICVFSLPRIISSLSPHTLLAAATGVFMVKWWMAARTIQRWRGRA